MTPYEYSLYLLGGGIPFALHDVEYSNQLTYFKDIYKYSVINVCVTAKKFDGKDTSLNPSLSVDIMFLITLMDSLAYLLKLSDNLKFCFYQV